MVEIFREVRRVMKPEATLWLNLGDSYAAGKAGRTDHGSGDTTSTLGPNRDGLPNGTQPGPIIPRKAPEGLKPKDLCGIPWRVAFSLQADGWYLRQDIIWEKGNPMPESVVDRNTKSHEYIFLLTKSPRYYYDNIAIQT
jgi:DNA modification methylase